MTRIYNVIIDGIIDAASDCNAAARTILFGDSGAYGENEPDSKINIIVSNMVCNSKKAVFAEGFLTDCVISNIDNKNPNCPVIIVSRENGLNNIKKSNMVDKC